MRSCIRRGRRASMRMAGRFGCPTRSRPWKGTKLYPGMQGGTNWYSPSWSPHTGLFYLAAWKDYYSYFSKLPGAWNEGQSYFGGATKSAVQPIKRGAVNMWTEGAGHGEIIALDPKTGVEKWAFKMHDVTDSGILTTATDVLFTGSREGYFWALDARTGAVLWHATTGGQISSTAITYMVEGSSIWRFRPTMRCLRLPCGTRRAGKHLSALHTPLRDDRTLQRGPIPLRQAGGRLVRTLQEFHYGFVRRTRQPNIVVFQEKLLQFLAVEGCRRTNMFFSSAIRFRRGITIKSRSSESAISWPEPSTDHLVRIGLAGDCVRARDEEGRVVLRTA